MFKLAKILSSGSNVPEPQKLPVESDMSFKYGAAIVLRDGMAFNATVDEKPTHICGQNSKNDSAITCYPITADMIFETTIKGDPTTVYVGSKVKLSTEQGAAVGVSNVTSGGTITIFDLNGATKSGDKIYVRFN